MIQYPERNIKKHLLVIATDYTDEHKCILF